MLDSTDSQIAVLKPEHGSNAWSELIADARGGCDIALGEISLRVRSYLLLVAQQHFDHRVTAKFGASDVVQQSLIEACEGFKNFKGDSEAEVRAWVKRIVINNLIDQTRKYTHTHSRSTQREVSLVACVTAADHAQPTASVLICRQEDDLELRRALKELPPKQRRVVELRHRDGCGYGEIASQLEVSEPAVRMLWSRAVRQLKYLLLDN